LDGLSTAALSSACGLPPEEVQKYKRWMNEKYQTPEYLEYKKQSVQAITRKDHTRCRRMTIQFAEAKTPEEIAALRHLSPYAVFTLRELPLRFHRAVQQGFNDQELKSIHTRLVDIYYTLRLLDGVLDDLCRQHGVKRTMKWMDQVIPQQIVTLRDLPQVYKNFMRAKERLEPNAQATGGDGNANQTDGRHTGARQRTQQPGNNDPVNPPPAQNLPEHAEATNTATDAENVQGANADVHRAEGHESNTQPEDSPPQDSKVDEDAETVNLHDEEALINEMISDAAIRRYPEIAAARQQINQNDPEGARPTDAPRIAVTALSREQLSFFRRLQAEGRRTGARPRPDDAFQNMMADVIDRYARMHPPPAHREHQAPPGHRTERNDYVPQPIPPFTPHGGERSHTQRPGHRTERNDYVPHQIPPRAPYDAESNQDNTARIPPTQEYSQRYEEHRPNQSAPQFASTQPGFHPAFRNYNDPLEPTRLHATHPGPYGQNHDQQQEGYYSEDDWGPYQASQPDPNNEAEARFRAANTFRPTIPLADQIVDDDYYYSLPIPWNVTPFGTPNDKDDLKQIEKADVLKEMYFTGTVPSYVEWRSMFISYVHTRKIPNHKKCRIMLRTIDKSVNEYKALRNILNSRMGDPYRDAIVMLERVYGGVRNIQDLLSQSGPRDATFKAWGLHRPQRVHHGPALYQKCVRTV
jgi:hypothetical protein